MFFAFAIQAATVVGGAVGAWWLWSLSLLSLLYGGAVALANTSLLVWHWRRGLSDFHCDGPRHLKGFHRSLKERFFVVGLLLAAGFGLDLVVPGMQALPILVGFCIGQLAWMIALPALRTN
jgi:hypothetical protein